MRVASVQPVLPAPPPAEHRRGEDRGAPAPRRDRRDAPGNGAPTPETVERVVQGEWLGRPPPRRPAPGPAGAVAHYRRAGRAHLEPARLVDLYA